ncbi:MAG: cbb3-type cytochrome oxidase assembly protein CcoS [Desulfobulbaceae bacterium]|nr:cbb3-type cytochrome oxidase assembly protein CcoS [Desulfobulbaceae bacterium]
MFKSIVLLMLLSLFMGIAAWLVFIWAVKKGQFDDMEGPKYRMLDDDPKPQQTEDDND